MANVKRKVKDIQRNSGAQEREKQQYDAAIKQIEAAALNSFNKQDVARDSTFAREIGESSLPKTKLIQSEESGRISLTNRFGEDSQSNNKKAALDTIEKSFAKKNKWLEAKNAEGRIYYWNKDTLGLYNIVQSFSYLYLIISETKFEPPKTGFLSLEEQGKFRNVNPSSSSSTTDVSSMVCKPDPYGGWKTVKSEDGSNVVDLELPNQDVVQLMLKLEEQQSVQEATKEAKSKEVVFEEKTVDTLKRPMVSRRDNKEVVFKKRNNASRNIRARDS